MEVGDLAAYLLAYCCVLCGAGITLGLMAKIAMFVYHLV